MDSEKEILKLKEKIKELEKEVIDISKLALNIQERFGKCHDRPYFMIYTAKELARIFGYKSVRGTLSGVVARLERAGLKPIRVPDMYNPYGYHLRYQYEDIVKCIERCKNLEDFQYYNRRTNTVETRNLKTKKVNTVRPMTPEEIKDVEGINRFFKDKKLKKLEREMAENRERVVEESEEVVTELKRGGEVMDIVPERFDDV